MSKYRIVEHNEVCFEPQILRWWWPFWRHIASTSYTGHDWSPLAKPTREEALALIENHKNPYSHNPKIHEVP